MGFRLVRARLLRPRRDARPARAGVGQHADRSRRFVGERRSVDVAVRLQTQSAARHLRAQPGVSNRMYRIAIAILLFSSPGAAQDLASTLPAVVTTGEATLQ